MYAATINSELKCIYIYYLLRITKLDISESVTFVIDNHVTLITSMSDSIYYRIKVAYDTQFRIDLSLQ